MSADGNIVGKKKKRRLKCPNSYFVKWLDEWRKDAADKGLKSQYTYHKALKALQKYPVRLESGKACKVLEGFGDKICQMIEKKRLEHIAEGGTLSDESSDNESVPRKKRATTKTKRTANGTENMAGAEGGGGGGAGAGSRAYIPQYRSGAYALILTLYTNAKNGQGEMKKQELMKAAQPLADKDFFRPEPGCRYTSWSSMGTLIRKGYVIKHSSPAKYVLTRSGHELAEQIEGAAATDGRDPHDPDNQCRPLGFTMEEHPPPPRPTMPTMDQDEQRDKRLSATSGSGAGGGDVPSVLLSSDDEDEHSYLEAAHQESISNSHTSQSVQFSYVSDSGKDVPAKDQAAVKIDDNSFVGFLIRAKYEDLLLSMLRYDIDTSRCGNGGEVFAYLHNDDAPEQSSNNRKYPLIALENSPPPKRRPPKKPAASSSSSIASNYSNTTSTITHNLPSHQPSIQPARPITIPSFPSKPTTAPATVLSYPPSLSGDSQSYPPSLTGDSQSQSSVQEWVEPSITLHPGTFEIVLCVDNREVFGSGFGKEALLKELQKHSILMDVRVLQIGDFLWIARRKGGRGGGHEEVVLDYVVERKRMDDLASSITDGRFREQKFRMRSCQLRKAIYLVEDYGSVQHFSIPEDTLRQAIINTQVTDNFYVKRTRDIKESAAYLTIMTRYLQSLYNMKTLHGCSAKNLPKVPVSFDDAQIQLLTFEEYDKSTVKSRPLSVQEMFAKQLCQLAGVTPEKAMAITEHYPTPACLLSQYDQCTTQKQKNLLLTTIKFGATNRGIGPQLSTTIAMLYGNKDLL